MQKGRERISLIMVALFPLNSHMPPERQEKKVGKKSLQGEAPGESRDEVKARTAAQKSEQQALRAKAQKSALLHAAVPTNVHHMSTRHKTQSRFEVPQSKKSSSSSSSSSTTSGSSSSSSSDHDEEGNQDTSQQLEVPEQVKPKTPSRRISQKTTPKPAQPCK